MPIYRLQRLLEPQYVVNAPIVLEVLLIFENRVEIIHPFTCQESDIIYKTSDTASGKCSSTESDQNNIVAWSIVGCYKAVHLPNVLKACQRSI